MLCSRLELGADHGRDRAALSVEGPFGAVREGAGGDTHGSRAEAGGKGEREKPRAGGSGDEELGSVWSVEKQEGRQSGAGGLDSGWPVDV